jgi:hypothetical protein
MRSVTMKSVLWMCIACLYSNFLFAQNQTLTPRRVQKLPSILKESSGLIVQPPHLIWSHNDGDNEPMLYQMDTIGNILKKVLIKNQTNLDWEEICLDTQGHLYIGDFGNNNYTRQDLAIYKILNFKDSDSDAIVTRIGFRYEDQITFPPAPSQLYFDAEAMIAYSDSIYIFTKDFNTQPYTGATRIYAIPNQVGNHIAKLIHVFSTDNGWNFYGAVTGAAISPDHKKAVLLTYGRLFVFSDFTGKEFWKGRVQKYNILPILQREAITFVNNCEVYMSCESESSNPAALFSLDLCQLESDTASLKTKMAAIKATSNPIDSSIIIEISNDFKTNNFKLQVADPAGKTIFRKTIALEERKIILPNALFLTNGVYFYTIYSDEDDFNFSDKIIIQK